MPGPTLPSTPSPFLFFHRQTHRNQKFWACQAVNSSSLCWQSKFTWATFPFSKNKFKTLPFFLNPSWSFDYNQAIWFLRKDFYNQECVPLWFCVCDNVLWEKGNHLENESDWGEMVSDRTGLVPDANPLGLLGHDAWRNWEQTSPELGK